MLCMYHNDMDGHCSGALVHTKFGECKMVEMDYSKPLPLDSIEDGELVYIVDFSLQAPGAWQKLLAKTKQVVWIDHHKSTIDKAREMPEVRDLKGLRDDSRAACELVWEFLDTLTRKPDEAPNQMPKIVALVADNDIRSGKHEDTEFVAWGLGAKATDPSTEAGLTNWNCWIRSPDELSRLLLEGYVIKEYEKKQTAWALNQIGFEAEIDGLHVLCLNTTGGSRVFEGIKGDYDAYLGCRYDGQKWTVSMFAAKPGVNVLKAALKRGGGGHVAAAGFVADELKLDNVRPYKV